MQTNLSGPSFDQRFVTDPWTTLMQISVPRFVEMGKKSASLFEAQRPIVLFFFFFFFFVSPHFFLLSFPRQGKNATVGRPHFDFCPLLISKKQRKIERELARNRNGYHLIAPFVIFRCGIGWLSFDSGFVKNSTMIVPLVDFVPRLVVTLSRSYR